MIVFYGSIDNNLFNPPVKVLSHIKSHEVIKHTNESKLAFMCPAVTSFFKNTYCIFPTFDYKLSVNKNNIFSQDKDQKYFDRNVLIRDSNERFFSYGDPSVIFFTEKNSLVCEFLPPFLHKGFSSCSALAATYDIGKHFRCVTADYFFHEDETIQFKKDMPVFYSRFITDEPIQFKRFFVCNKTKELFARVIDHKSNIKKKPMTSLEYFYNLTSKFNLKKTYLKLIKQNLID